MRTIASLRHLISVQPRNVKRGFLIVFDFVTLAALVWAAYSIRFNTYFVPNLEQALVILAAPAIAIPIFVRMGLYRSVLRYLPDRAVWTILRAVTISVLAWVALAFLTQMTGASGVPRSIPLVYWVLAIGAITGSRFGAKWLLWGSRGATLLSKQTLIYGTGDAGTQLANALISAHERLVAGFVSEDPSLYGMDIMGIRVYPARELANLVTNFGIDEVIVTMPGLSSGSRRELVAGLGALGVKIRILPAIADLAAGKYLISQVRNFDIDDLLGRSPVAAHPELLASVEGKSILVTGAAGSIGSALSRALAGLKPSKLVLLDNSEHGLYQINRELTRLGRVPVVAVLGSVGDGALVGRIFLEHGITTVYHCAAYKHVSVVEENKLEGIRNNVLGTQVLVETAHQMGVGDFILISSDKAVRPASVMGATKRWAELIVRHYGTQPREGSVPCNFASVRFGNVIGSSGSVVPLFQEQIAAGGPVTLTDENMTRYFMSVREASELIVQAGALSESGDILVLEMGEPVRIRDLAENMIMLAGLSVRNAQNPNGDIEIVTIGAREGEKISEELFYNAATVMPTSHPKILKAAQMNGLAVKVPDMVAALRQAVEAGEEGEAKRILFDFVAH